SYRWWDGRSWTAHLRVPEPVAVQQVAPSAADAPVGPVAAPVRPVATVAPVAPMVVATVEAEDAADPRLGGTGAAPAVDLTSAIPAQSAPPSSAGRLRPDRPKSQLVIAALAALAVLVGAVFAGKALL